MKRVLVSTANSHFCGLKGEVLATNKGLCLTRIDGIPNLMMFNERELQREFKLDL